MMLCLHTCKMCEKGTFSQIQSLMKASLLLQNVMCYGKPDKYTFHCTPNLVTCFLSIDLMFD